MPDYSSLALKYPGVNMYIPGSRRGAILLLCSTLVSCVSVPLKVKHVTDLGFMTDPAFNSGARRDCGGGGYINGQYFIGFCDSATVNGSQLTSFSHNSFAVYGLRNKSDPTQLVNYAPLPKPGQGTFPPVVGPNNGNESAASKNFAIWPSTNYIASTDNKQAIGIGTCLDESSAGGDPVYYSTMFAVNVTNPNSLPANDRTPASTRIVPQLFYPTENYYGSFCLFNSTDGHIYLIGTSKAPTHGLVAARVTPPNLTNRNAYTYWNGHSWTTRMPAPSDPSANFFNFTTGVSGTGPSTGELFYSAPHNRLLLVFTDRGVDGAFYAASLNAAGSGPADGPANPIGWSDASVLYVPQYNASAACPSGDRWNYAGHAYPEWYAGGGGGGGGASLLLGWSACESWNYMARVDWA